MEKLEHRLDTFHSCIERQHTNCCESAINSDSNIVNVCNEKGETALHIACKHHDINAVTYRILSAVTNINVQNYWGQTPLHYAAAARSVKTMKLILHVPGIDVSCKDVNGYTALHTFVISSQEFDDNWKEGLKLLAEANIDINAKTNYGQTVLHLTSFQDENTKMLGHIMRKCKTLDLNTLNSFGENFLHIYCVTEIGHDCISLFEQIEQIDKSVLLKLLNQQDVYGLSPWCLMVENGEMFCEHLKMIIETHGVSVNDTDSLGNTVLHRCVGEGGSSSDNMLEIYKLLIKNSINVNCRNVFGHSAGALLYMDEVCKVLLQGKFDFTAPDRWGRIPLINVMNQNARPIVLETMLQTHPFTVNLRDIYESTPLHYAAYSGTEEYVEVLLKHGADLNAKDALGDFPIDTAFRHGKQACWKLLAKHMHLKTLNEKIFLHEARHVTLNLSSLYKVPMNDLLDGFPKNMDTFAADALKNKYKRGILHDVDAEIIEVKNIVASVREHVHGICEIVRGYDSRFRMSVFPTGSSAEGTKVGPPDEFDFALCIENLSANCVIETSAEIDGYACLKFKDSPISGDYIAFSDSDRYFLALPFLHYLFRYIRRALSERRLWEKSNLHRRSEDKFRVTSKKPVFNYDLYWTGAVFKHLQISIDLVPTVYQSGWWPSHFRFDRMKLMNEKVKAAGCFILMQTEENSFDQGWHQMNDSISLTCNLSYKQNRNRLLQISVAPAEITLIQSLPEVYRQAYALAKIVKSEALCPNVQIDIRPVGIKLNSKVSYRTHRNHSLFFPAIKPSAIMKSYWLKNCLFYVADEIQTQCTSLDKSSLQITILVYQKLLDFAASWNFQPYILQSSELFELARGNSYFEVFISRMIICINVVLAILGQQFPKENDVKTLLDTCRKNRAVLELKRLTY